MKIKDVNRGDTRQIDVTFYQSDGVTPYDISGGTVYFTVNASSAPADDAAALISKDVTVHTAPQLGQSRITLTATDTDITPGTYYYDIQLKDANSNILSSKQDKFIVLADITRRTT
jgi:hypothetical protein